MPNEITPTDVKILYVEDTKFVEAEKGFWVATRSNIPALKE